MKKGILIALLLALTTECFADSGYGGTTTGQQNTGYSAASGGSSSYNYRTYYQPYYYYNCGKRYTGYKAVSVPYQAQAAATVNNPVGAVNTDNSVAYHYEYNITYSQLPQQQGSTLYGYPNPLSASTYQNTDLAVLDQYVRLQSDAQTFLNEGHNRTSQRMQELMALAQIQASGQSNVAETLAKGLAIAEMSKANAATAAALSKANDGGPTVASKTTIVQGSGKTTVVPEQNGVPPQPPGYQPQVQDPRTRAQLTPTQAPQAQLAAKTTQIFQQKCVKCHNPNKPSGDLDLTQLRNITPEMVQKILSRVVDTDPLRRMPLDENNEPGQPLSVEELHTLFAAAGKP